MYKGKYVTAIIGAAGSGSRMGGPVPKQFMKLGGRAILEMAVTPFEQSPEVDEILVVTNQDFVMFCEELLGGFEKVIGVIPGGPTRQDSIGNGIRHLAERTAGAAARDDQAARDNHAARTAARNDQAARNNQVARTAARDNHAARAAAPADELPLADRLVLIHDGARPFVTREVITSVLMAASETGAAVPVVPCKDTIRQTKFGEEYVIIDASADAGIDADVDASADADIDIDAGAKEGRGGGPKAPVPSRTLDRDRLFHVQTPQGFYGEIIYEAYRTAARDHYIGTDDAGLAERLGYPVALAKGSYENQKITTKEDLPMEVRVGTGFDVHRLTEDRKLILGGVEIPYEKGLLGHSDADVMVHALMDAMLGAAGLGDIGRHFPDTDPQYEGISSLKLLALVREKVMEKGYVLSNADVTIIAQRPKLMPYIEAMEQNLTRVLSAEDGCINVKATTTEKLGFTGRGEGIAAEAVCSLRRR